MFGYLTRVQESRLASPRTIRGSALALLVLGALLGVAACGGSNDESLTVYSGRSEELVGPLFQQFEDETGIDLDTRYGNSTDLALLIGEEGDRSPADVFFSQSPGAVGFLAEHGLLAPLDDELLDRVDLPDEEYRGRVAIAPENASFQDFVTAMRQLDGDDAAQTWLRGMADNESPTYASNSAIVDAVSRGEVPMGLVNHYYNYRFLTEDPSLPSRNHVFQGETSERC